MEHHEEGKNECQLLDLPSEILMQIFSHLDSPFIAHSLRPVCKRVNFIVGDILFWRRKIRKEFRSKEFPLATALGLHENTWRSGLEIGWQDLSYHIEKERYLWRNVTRSQQFIRFGPPHFAPVDTVKIFNNGRNMISGGRDRLVICWDISNPGNYVSSSTSHRGWVWDSAILDNDQFYTCGWDSCVFRWCVRDGKLQEVSCHNIEKSATCVDCVPGLVAVGSTASIVTMIDPRINVNYPVFQYKIHKCVLTDLALADNIIYSASEDKTIGVFEIRKMKHIEPNVVFSEESGRFPRCISVKKNMLWVGGYKGSLKLFNINKDYQLVHELVNFSESLVTSLWAGVGTLVTGSLDKKVRILTPTDPVTLLGEISFKGEISCLDYKSGILAVACADHSVQVFDTDELLQKCLLNE